MPEAQGLGREVNEHVHTFNPIGGSNRYRCTSCGVIGHLPATLFRQRKANAQTIVAYLCQKQDAKRNRCRNEAVHVTGDRQASRCADHVASSHVASRSA